MASLLRFLLERQGMVVSLVHDGRAAIDALRSDNHFDLVILEMRLPQLTGMAVLTEMRGHPTWAATPLMFVSSVDRGTEIATALDAGANDFMTKPFDPDELLARLRRLLPTISSSA